MRNPPNRKRLGDEDIKSTFSLTSLRKLEEQLGYAMSQAGIATEKREHSGKLKANGANRGSSGPKIYSLKDSYNRAMLKAIASKNSFPEVGAQTIKNSFATLERQLNADDLRSIYNQIKKVPRDDLKGYDLNLLHELKNVFLEIDRDEERSRKNAPRPLTAGEQEAQLFAESYKSPSAERDRKKLNEWEPEERNNKRQRTNEDWWGGLAAKFAPVIGEVTNSILQSGFLENFGISFPKPEEQKKLVKAIDLTEKKEVASKAKIYEPDSLKPSLKEIEDRPSTFLNRLKVAPVLDSKVFSSKKSLTERMELWNSYMNICHSAHNNIQYYVDSRGNGNTPEERRTTKYSEYLQASIKKIKTLESEQGKILSGFLYLELAKVEHMVTGENAHVDDNGSFSTREASNASFYSTKGRGLGDLAREFTDKFSRPGEYKGDEVTSPHCKPSQPSNSEGLGRIRNRLYNKIPKISQDAIYDAQNVAPNGVNFVDTINVPRTVKTSDDFKSKFSEERTKFWNPTQKRRTSESSIPDSKQKPDPSPEKRSLTHDAQSVKDKINDNYTGVGNLQRIVDSPINFSESIFDVTSKIDIAIGVMKPKSSKFDFERHQQEGDLVKFLKDSKSLLNSGDRARGRSSGSDPRRENIYAYVAFLDDRIKILQDVVNDLKSSNTSQNMSIPTLKEMQANLGLELVRISDSLTPQEDLIGQFQAPHRVSRKNTGLDPLGPVHHGDSLKTLREEEMKEKLGPTFASMLDKNRFKGRESFAYSDKKVASANQDFLKEKVDEALKNFKNIRIENRRGEKGR